MILADKIITLRKKAGWSQEELASQLGVTRQSVSKWEGAQSVPDLDKVVQMSRLFGVSTDYLLKDELEEEEFVESGGGRNAAAESDDGAGGAIPCAAQGLRAEDRTGGGDVHRLAGRDHFSLRHGGRGPWVVFRRIWPQVSA